MLTVDKFVTASPEQWEIVIEGMRNPMNSWDKMDSDYRKIASKKCEECDVYKFDIEGGCDNCELNGLDCSNFILGPNDHDLMTRLAKGGSVHAKYRRMIPVWVTITAPLYWWKEFDTYKVGTVGNSCSTMHKIHAKEFTLDDFSTDHLEDFDDIPYDSNALYEPEFVRTMECIINMLNTARTLYLEASEKLKVGDLTAAEQKHVKAQRKLFWWQMIQLNPSSYNQKRTIFLNYEVLYTIYRDRRNHKLDEWHVLCDWIKTLPYSELITMEE